ncbi:TetR/AcrR family transcriptional regulator [Paenibacillus sp. CAA11]|uniref:TetR/AcrR family transcriptional regulator n=1 Tax=Paenibacillus sp. CAA11 TaxID=1532905 RepID=UPI000D37BEA8|nr:TetR/AcrR family transcriptional regulator [Paenibacillus sp. CAA11]AWB43292.1 TetR/AcrR family transcriptional regulator [Paenibacillus sp. CAA11]
MVRPREFVKEQALEEAMQLFWDKGYEATSLSDLTAGMGIQRPSLYAAFGDKKQLFESALRKYTAEHALHVKTMLAAGASVKEGFRLLFEGVVDEAGQGDSSRGCFCINTMVELAPHDEKFEILTREHQMYLAAIFQEALEKGKEAGELAPKLNVKAVAQTLVVSLIGLTVLMKSRPDRAFADHSIQMVLGLID